MMRLNFVAGATEHPHPICDEMPLSGFGLIELPRKGCRAAAAEPVTHHENLTNLKLSYSEFQRR